MGTIIPAPSENQAGLGLEVIHHSMYSLWALYSHASFFLKNSSIDIHLHIFRMYDLVSFDICIHP